MALIRTKCTVCGKSFEGDALGRFAQLGMRCSAKCKAAHRRAWYQKNRPPMTFKPVPCNHCGKKFTPGMSSEHYCSTDCRRDASNARRKELKAQRRGPRECKVCGTPFRSTIARPKTCSPQCTAELYVQTKRKCRQSFSNVLYERLYYEATKNLPEVRAKRREYQRAYHATRREKTETPEQKLRRVVREIKRANADLLKAQQGRASRIRYRSDEPYREQVKAKATAHYYNVRRHENNLLFGAYTFFRENGIVPSVLGGHQKIALTKVAIKEAVATGFPIPAELAALVLKSKKPSTPRSLS